MACCREKAAMQASQDLQQSAANFGFDPAWIADVVEKYGPEVLAVVVEAARGGFSIQLIQDVMQKLGPLVLELLVNLLNKQKMARSFTGDEQMGDQVMSIDIGLIEVLVQKYLPLLLEKFGPQLVQMAVDWIVQHLQGLKS